MSNDEDPKTPEFTSSITETDHEGLADSSEPSLEKLLGRDSLRGVRRGERALLRVQDGSLKSDVAKLLGLPGAASAPRFDERVVPLVIGPFDANDLKKAVEAGLLKPHDALLSGFGRWRTLRELFPDFMGGAVVEDEHTSTSTNTLTATATATASTTGFDENEQTRSSSHAGLELDAVDEEKSRQLTTPETTGQFETPSYTNSTGLPLESDEETPAAASVPAPRAAPTKPAPVTRASSPSPAAPVSPTLSPVEATAKFPWPAVMMIGAVIALGAYVWSSRSAKKSEELASPSAETVENVVAVPADCPPSLRPRSYESLYSGDSALVAKIRPILTAYENGSTSLSAADERTLREVADPASASLEARRLAANQLAVYYLASSRIDDARRVLKPLLDLGAPDATTLLNVAFLQMGNGEYADARESATAALRLMGPSEAWVAHSVVGLIEGYRGRLEQSEFAFKDALRRSSNNPFVYGLYVRTLTEVPGQGERIAQLMKEALWTDPDRLIDSPIRAPLAGHVIVSLALEGLTKGAEARESRLSNGKKAFVRWLEARYRRNPLSQPLARVTDMLAGEDDPQSQLLYAFSLREQGRMDEAAQVLSRIIPLMQGMEDLRSSWPWSFAGDVQYARRNVSQGIVFYQNAMSRNPQDIAAVLGMALAFRESGEFKLAEQRLSEALSLDPNFVPALLRVSRFEWHSGRRAQ